MQHLRVKYQCSFRCQACHLLNILFFFSAPWFQAFPVAINYSWWDNCINWCTGTCRLWSQILRGICLDHSQWIYWAYGFSCVDGDNKFRQGMQVNTVPTLLGFIKILNEWTYMKCLRWCLARTDVSFSIINHYCYYSGIYIHTWHAALDLLIT